MTRIIYGSLLAVVLSLFIMGCYYYPISKDLRAMARTDITFKDVLKNPDAYKGSIVIWGGRVIKAVNRQEGTEITVLEIPLDSDGSPGFLETSHGRFIIKTTDFLDPAIYSRGREITVAGEITGKEKRPLGEINYIYPMLNARQIHLWKRGGAYIYTPAYMQWQVIQPVPEFIEEPHEMIHHH